jgi:hypothetical protein
MIDDRESSDLTESGQSPIDVTAIKVPAARVV